ncbi:MULTISPECIES: hypothetical protein [unclassified Streptomyces]|uniref:hypothetical protein n=1 Tax=unclassified Streptomyces TaxID=2593676 RepID=UPI0008053025|nr:MULTISPECIES: hypothetical protein [unclassified Streptomyces]MYR75179.1 hypothetical protein [Streptomyces sp. SID4925]SBU98105.1 hypothetical protein YUMDRAFT_06055 [Streptomyces sp. OspMP-M45]
MTSPTPTQDRTGQHEELLALVALLLTRLVRTWKLLTTAQDALLRALERIRPGVGATPRIRAAVRDYNQQVARFDREVRALVERWAATDLPTAYRDGALQALRRARRDVTLFRWTTDHQAALTPLTATFYVDLIRRVQETVRRAQAFSRAAQDAAREVTAGRQHEGIDSPRLAAEHPLTTVIYADQSRHPVEAWARSALLWQGVVAANTGAINTARWELGAQWMQCVDGSECGFASHPDTDHADGTIRSIDDASMYPAAHHGCIRSWIPRPDLNGRTDIESGDPT